MCFCIQALYYGILFEVYEENSTSHNMYSERGILIPFKMTSNIILWYYTITWQVAVSYRLTVESEAIYMNFSYSCYIKIYWSVLPFEWIFYPSMIFIKSHTDHLETTGSQSWQICRSSKCWHISLSNIKKLLLLIISPPVSKKKTSSIGKLPSSQW